MNGSRQRCRWLGILWLSKPMRTRARSLQCFRCAERAGAFVSAMSQDSVRCLSHHRSGGWRWGLGLGVGWWLQPCFLSLTKHRSLCDGRTSLTPRNRDLVLDGRSLLCGPTTAAMTDALITRSFEKKKKKKSVLETWNCSRWKMSRVTTENLANLLGCLSIGLF